VPHYPFSSFLLKDDMPNRTRRADRLERRDSKRELSCASGCSASWTGLRRPAVRILASYYTSCSSWSQLCPAR
jgi:hypothetical protein